MPYKSARKLQANVLPQKLKFIMHETLAEQGKERLDLEKKQNLILSNVKECSGKLRSKKTGFGISYPSTLLEATILGKSSTATEPADKARLLELVLESREKINIFRLLRYLKTADQKFRSDRVSHDYSQATKLFAESCNTEK